MTDTSRLKFTQIKKYPLNAVSYPNLQNYLPVCKSLLLHDAVFWKKYRLRSKERHFRSNLKNLFKLNSGSTLNIPSFPTIKTDNFYHLRLGLPTSFFTDCRKRISKTLFPKKGTHVSIFSNIITKNFCKLRILCLHFLEKTFLPYFSLSVYHVFFIIHPTES